MFLFSVITATTVMAMASAWSMQFPQFYHTLFPQSTPTPTPLPLRPLFQDPLLQPRYYVHAPVQFRQPLQLYQPSPTARLPTVPSTTVLTPSPVTDVHHHHHVFHYYYNVPIEGGTQRTGRNGDRRDLHVARQLCDDHHPVTVAGYPSPVYIPVPSPPPPPSTSTTMTPPTLAPPLCDHDNDDNDDDDDDTVVVDNVDYFPFDRRPMVMANMATGDRGNKGNQRSKNSPQNMQHTQKSRGQKNMSSFILANYLLPPDK